MGLLILPHKEMLKDISEILLSPDPFGFEVQFLLFLVKYNPPTVKITKKYIPKCH